MHIPPYHKRESWQRFFVGVCLGGIIAYCVLMYMYGSMYERLLAQNLNLESQVSELESKNESLLEDQQDLDEKINEPIVVDSISITIENREEMRFDRLIAYELEELIKQEIDHVIGKPVTTIDESDRLLITAVENKAFTIDDFTYYFEVYKLTISESVKLIVKAKHSSS